MENVIKHELSVEGGEKAYGYENFDINCIKGAQLPIFESISLDGQKYRAKDLKGKINIFNFWFKSCKPCLAKIPGLNIIAQQYSNDEINFLSVSRDDEKTLQEFVNNNRFDFIHLLDGKEIINETFNHIGGYPAMIITDHNLKIVEVFTGGKSDSTAIQETVHKLSPIISKLVAAKNID